MASRFTAWFRPGEWKSLSEDMFASTRMSFGDHLEELRWRLWRALLGFGLFTGLVFLLDGVGYYTGASIGIGKPVMDAISAPVEKKLVEFYDRRAEQIARKIQAGEFPAGMMEEAQDVPIELDL
jgi:hypothetical protein